LSYRGRQTRAVDQAIVAACDCLAITITITHTEQLAYSETVRRADRLAGDRAATNPPNPQDWLCIRRIT
jgi:hypothetical protein